MVKVVKGKAGRPKGAVNKKKVVSKNNKAKKGYSITNPKVLWSEAIEGLDDLTDNQCGMENPATCLQKFVEETQAKQRNMLAKYDGADEAYQNYLEEQALSDAERCSLASDALKKAAFDKTKAPHNPNTTKNGFTEGNGYAKGNGRPLGSKHKVHSELEKIGESNAMFGLEQIITWMKEGNFEATKYLLDRVYPIRKDVKRYLGYEGTLKTLEDVNDCSEHIVKMMVDGEISAEDAIGYGKVLEARLKTIAETSMAGKYAELKAFVDSIAMGKK